MDLDNFEQDLLRFTGAVTSVLERALGRLEASEISSADADSLSNLLIGLREYVSCSEDELCDQIEDSIRQGYLSGLSGTLEVDENGTIQFPEYIVRLLGWKPGDPLSWKNNNDGSVSVRKLG